MISPVNLFYQICFETLLESRVDTSTQRCRPELNLYLVGIPMTDLSSIQMFETTPTEY